MKTFFLVIFATFFCNTLLYAQGEANTWLFADQSGINFNTNPPSYLSNPNRIANGTTFPEGSGGSGATISDSNGNLLFYTSGHKIWDRNHNLMLNGDLEGNNDGGINNAIIVKQPESNSIYYVFTFHNNYIDFTVFPPIIESGNRYHIVDMSKNGGLGEVISKDNLLENVVRGGNSVFAATSHCNGRDVWILSHEAYNNTQTLSSHLLTPTGLQTFAYSANCDVGLSNQMKFSPDGTRLFVTSYLTTDRLLDFDASTGIFSNPQVLYTNPSGTTYDFHSQGCEFSPDGTKLYVGQNKFSTPAHVPSDNNFQRRLLQYDMEASDIAASQTIVFDFPFEPATPPFPGGRPVSSNLGIGALQLAPNGTIYIAHNWFGTLSEIRNPNGSVATCDFVQYGFALLGTDYLHPSAATLPTFPTTVLFPPVEKPVLADVSGCSGISLDAGTGYDTYTWVLPDATTATGQTLVANQAGTYILEVTKNCFSAKDTVEVSFIGLPTLDLGLDKQICAGSSTILNAPSGFTSYTWTLPNSTTLNSQNLTATEAGTYSLSVTDACGTATDDIDVTILPNPTLDLGLDKQICAGASTILNAPSGFTSYEWTLPNSTTSNSQNLTATEAGTYSLSVTDACGTATDNIDVSILPNPTVDLGTDIEICAGASTILNAPSGFTSYTWTLPNSTTLNSQNLTATEAGTYSLTVSNSCGTATDDIDVVISPLPTVDLGLNKQICAGTSTILNAPSGFTSYTWVLPNNSVSNLQNITVSEAGVYKLTVTNSCGAATDEIKIQVAPNPSLDLGNDVFTCQNDTTLFAPLGFDSYNWILPNNTTSTTPTITANQAGNYILKVENNCGIAFDTVSVSFNQKPNVDLGIDTLLCQNENVIVSLPTDYNYLWFDTDTSKTRSFSNAGIYYFDIINECGAKRDSIIINNFVEPTVNLGEDKLLCEDEIIIISVNNPTNFPVLWSTGDTTNSIEINKKGTYSVQLFSNCQILVDSIQIDYKNKPNLTPQKDTILCQNENYFVEIDSTNQDVSIIWFDGNTFFSRFLNGESEYSYTLFNECGSVSDTFSIILPTNEELNINLGEDKILCRDENILLDATNENDNLTYLWNTGSTESQITVTEAGTYIVKASNLCTSKSDTIKINYIEELNTSIKLTQKDCGEAILNVNLKENETIKWNDGSIESEFIPTKSGVYEAQVTNDCESKIYSIEVKIINFDEEFPNVITPNDDGFNDAYVLPFEGAQIFVYDRWEKLVYRNDNYQNDWSPKNLTGGAYYLLIKHPCLDGNKKVVLSILK
ncbi:hypothetical protein Fleli_1577 [Bernardetia litoralis DSM 6794]|uniref:PKD/Chitinase domain-containing protein n=1 Tax=Bernardetia litoralis (strain ATCC 23117 / DSM 6794 / NBRC 15988 / NCIMB 1366 / Fx l1 / Sio-4) TaxID=880071 RepID=I4AJ61_BERLS|nr:gliding motility-associated C-terminal domain-containing protein [Bernardetia litoralis]AFM03996.1 hypothetical protein Fleli_1577 [Bernardetia litoralis DSM 6794]